jgi:hypothetical protein
MQYKVLKDYRNSNIFVVESEGKDNKIGTVITIAKLTGYYSSDLIPYIVYWAFVSLTTRCIGDCIGNIYCTTVAADDIGCYSGAIDISNTI